MLPPRVYGWFIFCNGRLLVYQGQLLPAAMQAERVVEVEVMAAIRQQGLAALVAVEAVVLETDGSFTVIKRADNEEQAALASVPGYGARHA